MPWLELLKLALFLLFLFLVPYGLLAWSEKNSRNNWKVAAEGVFNYATSEVKSFSMAPIVKRVTLQLTRIHFEDGKSIAVVGHPDFPPKGSKIRVLKNKSAECRVEII